MKNIFLTGFTLFVLSILPAHAQILGGCEISDTDADTIPCTKSVIFQDGSGMLVHQVLDTIMIINLLEERNITSLLIYAKDRNDQLLDISDGANPPGTMLRLGPFALDPQGVMVLPLKYFVYAPPDVIFTAVYNVSDPETTQVQDGDCHDFVTQDPCPPTEGGEVLRRSLDNTASIRIEKFNTQMIEVTSEASKIQSIALYSVSGQPWLILKNLHSSHERILLNTIPGGLLICKVEDDQGQIYFEKFFIP